MTQLFVKLSSTNTVEKYPVYIEEINSLHPDLPGLDDENLRSVGYERAIVVPDSLSDETINLKYEVDTMERSEEYGVWYINLKLVSRFSSEEEKKVEVEKRWKEVRSYRDAILMKADNALTRSAELEALGFTSETNSFVIKDSSYNDIFKWKHQLREITNSPNPWNIIWPAKPEDITL